MQGGLPALFCTQLRRCAQAQIHFVFTLNGLLSFVKSIDVGSLGTCVSVNPLSIFEPFDRFLSNMIIEDTAVP